MASVTVRVPAPLRALTGGDDEVSAEGATVRAVLDDLDKKYPGFRDRMCDDQGVRRYINVYLGEDDIRFLAGLDTEVKPGDSLSVVPAIAGGRPVSDDLRFARHLNLAGVGPEGQRRLAAAGAEVQGRGLRGWVARRYLEAAGVGQVTEGAPGERGGWAAGQLDDPSCRAVVEGALDALDQLRAIVTR